MQGVERKVLELKKEIFSIHKTLKYVGTSTEHVSRDALTVYCGKAA